MFTQENIKQLAIEMAPLVIRKEWLTKEELMQEFGIKKSLLHNLINDSTNPLPYTRIGDKKQLFKREDINTYLERNKRNVL